MEWIQTLDQSIKKWMNVEQNFELFEANHTTKPKFLSIARKERESGEVLIRNGALHDNKKAHSDGYTVEGYIGDDTRGWGQSFVGTNKISKVPKKLLLQLDNSMDSILKVGLASYIGAAAQQIAYKDDSAFSYIDEAPIVDDIQDFSAHELVNLPSEKQVDMMKRFSEELSNLPNVINAVVSINTNNEKRWFVNSEGTKIRSINSRGSMSWSLSLMNKDSYQRFLGKNIIYNPKTDWSEIDGWMKSLPKVSEKVDELYNAPTLESGTYPVIFSGKSFGTFMHEAVVAHLLSGRYVSAGLAPAFEDKIGQQVMPDFLSIEAVPGLKNGFGSYKYDEEGIRAKDDVLVNHGVLMNFLHDRNSAYDLGLPNNGHSRVEWVVDADGNQLLPEPRVSNTKIVSHTDYSEKDLVDGLRELCEQFGRDYGIYVGASENGQVDIVDGNFVVWPDEMWKVYTDGRWERVSGAKIVGSPHMMLDSIVAASNSYQSRIGYCGADSGYVPTQDMAPSVLLPSINVMKEVDIKLTDRLA